MRRGLCNLLAIEMLLTLAVLLSRAVLADPKALPVSNELHPGTHGHHNEVRYEYRYSVDDPASGVVSTRWEHRHGEYVKGAYSLLEPDGKVRTVDYEVDGPRGFHAVVRTTSPANSLLSSQQLAKSLSTNKDPPVNVLTNRPHEQPERQGKALPLPPNFHSTNPNYYLAFAKGQPSNYKEASTPPDPPAGRPFTAAQGFYHSGRGSASAYVPPGGREFQPSPHILPPVHPATAYPQHTEAIFLPLGSLPGDYYGG